jgi:very-short-patch-repair endonuclease
MLEIEATIASKVGFASHQNAVPLIRELRLRLAGEQSYEHCRLALEADPHFVQPKTWQIDRLRPGDELSIPERHVQLNATLLDGLTESLTGTVTLTVVGEDNAQLAAISYPVELLAHNEWGGTTAMAELLPAFVMPNDPAIDRVLRAASDALRGAGKSPGIDGYRNKDRSRVWQFASAIWSAVAGLRLAYALPPASFERVGQKVRTPGAILEGRLATCLDTALLFAAALEQAGLNPIIVMTKGHAFTGVWLQPVEFSNLITDEPAALRRRLELDDLLLFETTLATNEPPGTFSQAIAAAKRQIAEDADSSFELAVDIRRARLQQIRPLGVALAPAGHTDGTTPRAEGLEEAPLLPGFDVDVEQAATTPSDRIQQWQRKLLNLTTSNRLLHVADSAKVLRLLCPDPGALEDMIASGRKVRIAPMPELDVGGRDEKLYEQQTHANLREEVARQTLERGEALAELGKDKLDGLLVELYRKAKSDIEEGGANTLYLALGFLKWKKSAAEQKVYRAPLILVPIRLERKSALSGVVMVQHEDEPRFNLTLLELLRQDFELTIPGLDGDLPEDGTGIDVEGIWRTVRTAIRNIPGFEVVNDVVLGTFSFAKYLMWKDLVDRADRLKESPLVRHLIDREASAFGVHAAFPRAEELDYSVAPAELFAPLPADSSQLAALVASARGHSFVLDGPPGCGKSQTIANMIAHNLALGRRVLFVAEKKAALEVVQRRLADKGLAPFCLELHSSKATKTAVLHQLDQAWTTRDALSAAEWQAEANEAHKLRNGLNELVSLLHHRDRSGWTIQRAIGMVVREGAENAIRLNFGPGKRHDAEEIATLRDVVRRLGIARKDVDALPSALNGVATSDWSNAWAEDIANVARTVPQAIEKVHAATSALLKATALPLAAEERAAAERLLGLTRILLDMHGHDLRFAFAPTMQDQIVAVREAVDFIESYRREETALSARYAPEAARRIDVSGLQAAWTAAEAKLWPLSKMAQSKIRQTLAQSGGAGGKVQPALDLPRLQSMRSLLERLDAVSGRASGIPGWAGLATERAVVEAAIARADRLRSAIAAEADGPEMLAALRRAVSALVLDANELLSSDSAIAVAAERLGAALAGLDATSGQFAALSSAVDTPTLAELAERAVAVVTHAARLRDWANWRRVRDEAIQSGLVPLVQALESGRLAAAETMQAFELAYAHWFAFTRMDEEPLLKAFAATEHEDRIQRFRDVEDRMGALASRYIRAKICGLIPDKMDTTRKDGYAILKRQLQLQRAHKPIRQLATEMGDAFTRLAPCMLMSPLSIAQYLPADQALFDLVIFDEASQITPWDAIGAMARGKQVVIAGDPRQMPPSNDFQRATGTTSDDDGTEPDLASILEECLAAGVPQHSLDWHYRSRHESLIAFSNHRYYESRLVTFPAPETRPSAVIWRRVPGVWARGTERTNQVEAKAIVDEAVRRLRDPGFLNAAGQPLTIGIITMNVEQMRLVEDLLDKARRAYPSIEAHFADDRLEPVVVRNLETAQGDERDVILLGVGFGPTEPEGRTMSMHFGKLNTQGGWRRLNVAITRARAEMVVFTSFDPGMIDLTRTSQQAVADLKHFIEYAHRGPRAIAEADRGSMGGADSPFEEGVAAELRRRGWTVVPQVGVSKFRIDIGVVHPDRPGDYLLGVECDGASYHSAATARDRDKVRASILGGLGWRLLRVWSTDWWTSRSHAADRLHEAMLAMLEEDRAAHSGTTEGGGEIGDAAPDEGMFDMNLEAANDRNAHAPSVPQDFPIRATPEVAPDSHGRIEPAFAETQTRLVADQHEPALASSGSTAPANARVAGNGRYRLTEFSAFEGRIDPERFYDTDYNEMLASMIAHVLSAEAPIAETLLVQRIARAHGFQRSGRIIRDRVMGLTKALHHIVAEEDGNLFAWRDIEATSAGTAARYPADDEHIRQIEEISLAELRATGSADPVEIARSFGIRRLSATARARIERALAFDPD